MKVRKKANDPFKCPLAGPPINGHKLWQTVLPVPTLRTRQERRVKDSDMDPSQALNSQMPAATFHSTFTRPRK